MLYENKKCVFGSFVYIFLFIPVITFGHYFAFPQETNCILLGFSGLKNSDDLYYDKSTPSTTIDSLRGIIASAELRNKNFWGTMIARPKYIFCNNEHEYYKYGASNTSPAITHTKLGSYIVISSEGKDINIIAHEICHTELYNRIGFLKYHFKIPAWFDEGLAMQLDDRTDFSEDNLKKYSDNFKNIPALSNLKTAVQFAGNSLEEQVLNYAFSKYQVHKWYTREKLEKLIYSLKNGENFDTAFANVR